MHLTNELFSFNELFTYSTKEIFLIQLIIYLFNERNIFDSTNYLHIQRNNYFDSINYLYIQRKNCFPSASYLYIKQLFMHSIMI